MGDLDVEAAFLITIGHGMGPETEVVISVTDEEGRPVGLDFNDDPVEVFIALSAMFGSFSIPLQVTNVQPMQFSFYGLRVKAPKDLGVEIEDTVPGALGVIVETGQDRGQALAWPTDGAHVTSWFGKQVQEPPKL